MAAKVCRIYRLNLGLMVAGDGKRVSGLKAVLCINDLIRRAQ